MLADTTQNAFQICVLLITMSAICRDAVIIPPCVIVEILNSSPILCKNVIPISPISCNPKSGEIPAIAKHPIAIAMFENGPASNTRALCHDGTVYRNLSDTALSIPCCSFGSAKLQKPPNGNRFNEKVVFPIFFAAIFGPKVNEECDIFPLEDFVDRYELNPDVVDFVDSVLNNHYDLYSDFKYLLSGCDIELIAKKGDSTITMNYSTDATVAPEYVLNTKTFKGTTKDLDEVMAVMAKTTKTKRAIEFER